MRVRSHVALVALLVPGCVESVDDVARDNTPPIAALRAPVIAELGTPVGFDASLSDDRDGDPLYFVFQWGDGSEAVRTSDAVAYHSFGEEAVFEVLVRAVDIHGAESLAAQDVAIRRDYPDPPDFCAPSRPCVVGDECDRGVCYANGGTLE